MNIILSNYDYNSLYFPLKMNAMKAERFYGTRVDM